MMKKILVIFCSVLFFSCSQTASEKNINKYFIGKWDVKIKGTPGGDSELLVDLNMQDGNVSGTLKKEDGIVDLTSINVHGDSLQVTFKHGIMPVNLLMIKADEDKCTCRLANMFDGESIRIKESN